MKTAIIIGGTGGIGKAIAHACAHDYSVAISGLKQDEVDAVVSELGDGHWGRAFDATSSNEVNTFIAQVIERYGSVDVLVNSQGLFVEGPIETMTDDQWRKIIEVNLSSVFYACRAVVPVMKQQGSGFIINISSIAGEIGFPNETLYVASKFAVNGLSDALYKELKQYNIRVTALCPGLVDTPLARKGFDLSEDQWKEALAPIDVARVVYNLVTMPATTQFISKITIDPKLTF
ncbi:MAG TPA: SDR family oxidoreductase [Patescibacteria group bacterium]|nr:SDR family oxidoreductase [Patescibacteria group bacterium]